MDQDIPVDILPPLIGHMLDEDLRKKVEQLNTDDCELVSDLPITIIPMHPVDPPEPRTPKS